MPRLLAPLKWPLILVEGPGPKARRIMSGINRGVRMELDLSTDAQTFAGLAEREIGKFFSGLSKGIKTAVDVGGAQGYYTLFFLMKTKASHVFTFEPDGDCYRKLIKNLELNDLHKDPRLKLSTQLVGVENDEKVCSLDQLKERLELPCLIKLDVEEAEREVLQGAKELLKTKGTRWIVETHTADLEKECVALFQKHEFSTTIVDKAWWRTFIPELRPRPHNRWLIAQ